MSPAKKKSSPAPIAKLGANACRQLKGIFTDIDDTVSWQGRIPALAYQALWQARKAGLRVIPVTGRPAGWVDHIARMWPVDAVVGENGGFYTFLDLQQGRDGKLVNRFLQSSEERAANRRTLDKLFMDLGKKLPGLKLASDQGYRAIDLAIDFCEDISPRLSPEQVQMIVAHFQAAGAEAKISSIHVNTWFGKFDKYSTCKLALAELFAEDLEAEADRYLYCGDSPNDEPFFANLPLTVGMANVSEFLPQLKHPPAYITKKPGGYGFAETIKHILEKRK